MAIYEIKVVEFKAVANRKEINGGFRLAMLYRDCPDSQYDTINHPAVFRTEERAQAFLAKIQASDKRVTMRNWGASIPAYSVL